MTGNIQPVFHQFDQSKVDDNKTNYHLSLQISIDGFCFALFHIIEKRYIGIGEYQTSSNQTMDIHLFENIVKNEKWLQGNFKSVSCSFSSSKSTLIPSPLFDDQELRSYLSLHTDLSPTDEVFSNKLIQSPIRNCFAIPHAWSELIVSQFPNTNILNICSTLIEAAIQNNQKRTEIMLHFLGGEFKLVITNGQQLLMSNSFNYQTSEDVIYYLLYVMEQLKLDPNKSVLILSGKILKDSAIYKLLYKYILTIEFADLPHSVEYAKPIMQTETHRYYPLIQQYLCE